MYINDNYFVDISRLVTNRYNFYAHIKDNENETLTDHTDLAKKYFCKINKQKKLDKIFIRFEELYFDNMTLEGKVLFRELLVNTIIFHDIGKINPFFQSKKMNNSTQREDRFCVVQSNHSFISSVLYIDYFIDKVNELTQSDRSQIRPFLLLNSYIISKHHGDLDDFNRFLGKFNDDEDGDKIIDVFNNCYQDVYLGGFSLTQKKIKKVCSLVKNKFKENSNEQAIFLYTYEKLLFSVLVACDFYATTEFMNSVEINEFGQISEIEEFCNIFNNTDVLVKIREYEENQYSKDRDLIKEKNINILRNEMFLDAEKELKLNIKEDVFFLEAPTGSGKSTAAMNLSFELLKENKTLNKIYYVYPFNTLIEQNINILTKIFEENRDVLNRITVVNSINPIKMDEENKKSNNNEDSFEYYSKALLNRQFLNYPMILTTHVSLFNTMFNSSKESSFGFHQLANSVIVLDEIQSYKNIIWTEIISFLKGFAKILNMKVIIMSATLPNLNLLTTNSESAVNLIRDREKYFSNPLFKERVIISYELMESKDIVQDLYSHIKKDGTGKNVLIEFIKKKSAYEFYKILTLDKEISTRVELMTGDDNSIERARILKRVSESTKGIILVATQVIEAGVDIDMDIGYKDISKLDSDEQFMGRINRSCKKSGKVYFFNYDDTSKIYREDVRVSSEFSLIDQNMRSILQNKDFYNYYLPVLRIIKSRYNDSLSGTNIDEFFKETVGNLDFKSVEVRMRLIEDNKWSMSVYLARVLEKNDGTYIDGAEVWKKYRNILSDNKMDYAEKQVKLSNVRSKMNNFIYEVLKNENFCYTDKVGELYYVEDGEKYFDNGKLNKERFQSGIGDFL
jgi:CRISPR-associated endonuclease/helicase Cas3